MTLRIERMESVVAPGKVGQAIADFFRGLIDGLMGK